MYDSRDRVLAGLFAVQLVAALVFGAIVTSWVSGDGATARAVAAPAAASDPLQPTAVPAAAATATGGGMDRATAESTGPGTSGTAAVDLAAPADATDPAGATAPAAGPDAGPTASSASAAPAARRAGNRTGVTPDTITVGSLVTQTGAINFRSSAQGTKAYIDMVNEAGGVHGRRIELLLRDDGLDVNRGQQAVQEMIDQGIFGLVALNAPLTEASLEPVVTKHSVPVIGAFSMTTTPLVYRFGAGYQNFGKVGGKALCGEGIRTPGAIYISNQNAETDFNIVQSLRLGLATCGLEIAEDDIHGVDVAKADFSDVVTQLRFSGVDGIYTILDATAMLRLQQSMNRQAFVVPHVSSPFGADPAVVRDPNVGDSFEGLLVLSDVGFLGGPMPGVQRYEREVSRRFGSQAILNWAGEMGWLGAHVFVETLRTLGPDPTREAFIAALDGTRGLETGMTRPISFAPIAEDPQGHAPNTCLQVGRNSGGTVRRVRDYECTSYDMTRF